MDTDERVTTTIGVAIDSHCSLWTLVGSLLSTIPLHTEKQIARFF
jgi:hypothetical protein